MVHLLRWGRESLEAMTEQAGTRHGSLDAGGALLLVGAITMAAVIGLPPLVTVGGGTGVAILFVLARSWVAVQEQDPA